MGGIRSDCGFCGSVEWALKDIGRGAELPESLRRHLVVECQHCSDQELLVASGTPRLTSLSSTKLQR